MRTPFNFCGINPSFTMFWRAASVFVIVATSTERAMSDDAWMNFIALALGFAVAGGLSSGYQVLTDSGPGFALLRQHQKLKAAASVPFLVFAAPFLILRNTLRDTSVQPRRIEFVMMATLLSGFWSLMSGTAVVALLRATGLLA